MLKALIPANILDLRRFATLTSVGAPLAGVVIAALFLTLGPQVVAREFSIYTVLNMPVDETAVSAAAAREIALAKGQALAFKRVIDRIVPKTEQDRVPQATSAILLDIVSGIEVEDEKTSPVRYLANLTVRFDRSAVRRFLREANIAFAESAGNPLIVLPVYQAAGTVQLWDAENIWLKSWQALPSLDGLLPLIVPQGDGEDIAAISPEQALNGDERRLRSIANLYQAKGAVLAVATLRRDHVSNSTVLEVALSRFGTADGDSTSVLSFTADPGGTIDELLETAAADLRDELVEGWKQDHLIRFGERRDLVAVVPLSGLAAWIDLRRRVSLIASVEKAELLSLSLNEATVRVTYFGSETQLVLAFAEHNMELNQGSVAWQLGVRAGSRNSSTGPVPPP
jgi:hypothetical protein